MDKSARGRFFEDFRRGETLRHGVPRTVGAGEVALYTALYGGRYAVHSADTVARADSSGGGGGPSPAPRATLPLPHLAA